MKIIVTNPNKIVSSAFIDNETELSFSVFINTTERWVQPDCCQSADDYLVFEFMNEECDRSELFDSVRLTAESEDDCKKLHRLYFTLHDKDQLWYLFLKEEVYTK